MRNLLKIIPLVLILSWVVSCKPGVPGELIQPDDMEEILYDYHIADGMAMTQGNSDNVSYLRNVYREAALRKHGVTQADFDSSLVYYYRHTELLHEIYDRLAKRLNEESTNLGSTANEMSQLGGEVGQGDTTTVWTYPQTMVMMPTPPYNVMSFSVNADSSYHAGDKMILNVESQFIFQDGVRDGVVMLAVTFRNDSVATQVMHMSSNQRYILQIGDPQMVGIKGVKGFIYLTGAQQSSVKQSIKMMCVRNMRLLKMKYKEESEKPDNQSGMSNGFAPPMGATPPKNVAPPPASQPASDSGVPPVSTPQQPSTPPQQPSASPHSGPTTPPQGGQRVFGRSPSNQPPKTAPRAPSAKKFP